MAIKTREEILESVRNRFGEDTSDESIALVEDITDTLNDYESRTKNSVNWEQKYKENDEAWRKKYRDRFFGGTGDDDDDDDTPVPPKKLTFENLFKEG